MRFFIFSKKLFVIPNPIALIECYCYQNDFYAKCDFLEDRKIEDRAKYGGHLLKYNKVYAVLTT